MLGGLQNIAKIPELKRRIIVTLLLLAVYRIGCHIPTPGIDADALMSFFARHRGTIFGLFDMFSGGALERLSVFALGIMPYISASIIMELMKVVIPALDKLYKEGEAGQKKIKQYTRYGTVILSAIQGLGISMGLEGMGMESGGVPVVLHPGWAFRLMTVLTLTSGTAFIMWLGEQITERGIGNGISLIIFAGIVARMPSAIINTMQLVKTGEIGIILIFLIMILMIAVVGFIVFMERGQRRIPVQYARRVVGRRMYGGQTTHLPLKVNSAGVIPPIFASSILMFPATIATFINVDWVRRATELISPGALIHEILYVIFIIFFCYFYTAVTFNPVDVAENMKKYGGYIPGLRPGKPTSDYIERILSRITLGGALYVSFVCVMPTVLVQRFNVPFYFGGTALLIVVGVAMDTVGQIESHMLTRHYEGFMKKRIGGRTRR
ncbi:preprotein translocase subunit SecY [Desulfobacca acetoxidans]|uniref:Protein translocase subunit SecY n=1 Tax=Desulfobacca acetoxidans (strain ATCC 700848 / DSM 11109 / ASRB2) TaxID=880072 RepID=F2NJB9_DESAR|nr:preprotein translocase subunit SecY [Desulfobacca acetoxidans]AEB09291.1 preprotein translocase, SecY subunit [Desulfobacca acetoxidans DSM 11109]